MTPALEVVEEPYAEEVVYGAEVAAKSGAWSCTAKAERPLAETLTEEMGISEERMSQILMSPLMLRGR